MIRELNVKVLDVVIIVYIFIAKIVDSKYLIILGNPYLASRRVKIIRDGEGNYSVKIYD